MAETNWYLEGVKLLPTTIIGLIAVYIAFAQWRTAHQKVVLDLFDRRMKVYEKAAAAAISVIRSARVDNDASWNLREAMRDARFLFGDDVTSYLDNLNQAFVDIDQYNSELNVLQSEPERIEVLRKKREKMEFVHKFYPTFPDLCYQYMRMDQKLK